MARARPRRLFHPSVAVVQQIALGMTSKLTIGSTLPRISYSTRADRFFIGSVILVSLVS